MRQIKFRAWNKTSKEWLKLKDCVDIDNQGCVYPFKRTDKAEIEIMQYTELKDKNGKEIYEGDIIGWELSNRLGLRSSTRKEGRDVMRFESENGVIGDGGAGMLRTAPFINNTSEVIGNIHENSELLEK